MSDNLEGMVFAKDDDTHLYVDEPWHILVVDDDRDIHALTSIVLENIQFENRKLKIYSAYSAEDACEFMKNNETISLVLLDVVMEKEDSGFDVVKYIREGIKNTKVRIILRTGQAGHELSDDIITKYDINDYKLKTDLTASQFKTSILSALKAFKEISDLSKKIIEKSEPSSVEELVTTIEDKLAEIAQNGLNEVQEQLLSEAIMACSSLRVSLDYSK